MSAIRKLPTEGYVDLLAKYAEDFLNFANSYGKIPSELKYTVQYKEEPAVIVRSARKAALSKFASAGPVNVALQKFAFDTRRVDQEHDRIPRSNLQYWHRTDAFVTEEQQQKILLFGKVFEALKELKQVYGTSPDWHESYVRVLYDTIDRTLRISQADSDISVAQLSYLEQLLDARYRLSMNDIEKLAGKDLKEAILSKDENLLRRGIIKGNESNDPVIAQGIPQIHNHLTVDANKQAQGDVLASLFNTNCVARKDGDRVIERTITIKIRDEIIE